MLRFEVERPPLADGRFRLRFELGDADRRRLYHWLDDAVRFVVYPAEPVRGPGAARRALDAAGNRRWQWSEMSYQTCPDWPELMEIAPDLQFKHYTARRPSSPPTR